jgi:general secretion pathway protein E
MTEHVRPAAIILDPNNPSFGEAFGTFLLNSGFLDRASMERAQRASSMAGDRFDQVLTKLGLLSEGDLAASLGKYLNLPHFSLGSEPPQRLLNDKIPGSFVRQNRVLPVRLENDTLTLAVVDPLDRVPLESVRFVVDHAIRHEIITPGDFERLVDNLYGPDQSEQS